MKNVFLIGLAVVLVMSMLFVGCAEVPDGNGELPDGNGDKVPPPVGQEIEFDFVTFWPAQDFQAAIGHVNWAKTLEDRVAAETPHLLKINMYYSLGPTQVWDNVRDGIYDIGATGPSYHAGIFPLWEGPEYPGELHRNNALTMSMTLQALYDEFAPLREEMADQGLKVMHFWSTGPGYFFMTPGNDVRRLADFAGKAIRVANLGSAVCIEALGAEAVLIISIAEARQRLEAGLLDGILVPGDTPKGFGLAAYVKHGTFAPRGYQHVFIKVMNEATWNALPAEVQAIFEEVNAAWPEYYGKLRAWGEAEGLQYCCDNIEGFTYYDLPEEDPAEYQRWVDATAHLVDDWIGGDATRQALWDRFVELDGYYATTAPWSTWTPDETPPPVPTFP